MATLIVVNSTGGERYKVEDIDFNQITPNDILSDPDMGLPTPPTGHQWVMLKDSSVVENDLSLNQLGFKDGGEAMIMTKVKGALI